MDAQTILNPWPPKKTTDWDAAFRLATVWPPHHPVTLCISNTKPPHETARNVFKEDKEIILAMAAKHGFEMLGTDKDRSVSFIKRKQKNHMPDYRFDSMPPCEGYTHPAAKTDPINPRDLLRIKALEAQVRLLTAEKITLLATVKVAEDVVRDYGNGTRSFSVGEWQQFHAMLADTVKQFAEPPYDSLPELLPTTNEAQAKMLQALELVIAIHENPEAQAPQWRVNLDPKAQQQIRLAIAQGNALLTPQTNQQ